MIIFMHKTTQVWKQSTQNMLRIYHGMFPRVHVVTLNTDDVGHNTEYNF